MNLTSDDVAINKRIFARKYKNLDEVLYDNDIPRYVQASKYPRDRLLNALAVTGGFRNTELRLIQVKHVDFSASTIYIPWRLKQGQERKVPVPSWVMDMIRGYVKQHGLGPEDYFSAIKYPNHRPDSWYLDDKPCSRSNLFEIVKRTARRSGLQQKLGKRSNGQPRYKIHPHSLRATFATRIIEETDNVFAAKELLGHAKLETTLIYSRMATKKLRQIIERSFGKLDVRTGGVMFGKKNAGEGIGRKM